MEAEVVKAPGLSAWSWARARESVVVLAAALACFGVLIAGMTFAVQPLDDDLRALQATMGNVRERLASVEVELGGLKEDMGGLRKDLGDLREDLGDLRKDLGGVKEDVEILKAGQARILALLEDRASDPQGP